MYTVCVFNTGQHESSLDLKNTMQKKNTYADLKLLNSKWSLLFQCTAVCYLVASTSDIADSN